MRRRPTPNAGAASGLAVIRQGASLVAAMLMASAVGSAITADLAAASGATFHDQAGDQADLQGQHDRGADAADHGGGGDRAPGPAA